MLTLDHAKNLAKWGLPQGARFTKGRYWFHVHGAQTFVVGSSMDALAPSVDEAYRIPSLEELMDFAKTLSLTWLVKPSPDGWRVTRAAEGVCKLSSWTDPSLFDVVYELIEREGGR